MNNNKKKKKNETIKLKTFDQDKILPQHVHVKPMQTLQ